MKKNILRRQEKSVYQLGDTVTITGTHKHPYHGLEVPEEPHKVIDISKTGLLGINVIVEGKLELLHFYDVEVEQI